MGKKKKTKTNIGMYFTSYIFIHSKAVVENRKTSYQMTHITKKTFTDGHLYLYWFKYF